jgi:hypothetical protein
VTFLKKVLANPKIVLHYIHRNTNMEFEMNYEDFDTTEDTTNYQDEDFSLDSISDDVIYACKEFDRYNSQVCEFDL